MTRLLQILPIGAVSALSLLSCRDRVAEPVPRTQATATPTPSASAAEVEMAPTPREPAVPAASASAGAVTELEKKDIKVGKGAAAKAGDTVSVHYTGTLLDGTKFDSSRDRGTPFDFKVGAGMVIKGWDEGIAGMKPGGRRMLTIPSDMAYGKSGRPPTIPPDSPLVFDVELVAIK